MSEETAGERELRLARQDIDKPRPEFWPTDLARYRAALKGVAAVSPDKPVGMEPMQSAE